MPRRRGRLRRRIPTNAPARSRERCELSPGRKPRPRGARRARGRARSRRPRRRPSSGRASQQRRGDDRVPEGARARRRGPRGRPLPRLARAIRSGSTCSDSTRRPSASSVQSERVGLIGHSHVALFFVAPRRRRRRPLRGSPRRGRDAARARLRPLAAQPRQRRPAARRRPPRRLARARHGRLDGDLPPRRIRHRRRRGGDRERRSARPARAPPVRRPVTAMRPITPS